MTFIKKKCIKGTTYLYEVKSVRIGNKVKHEHLRYIGKQPSDKIILETQSEPASRRLKIDATLLVFDQIAKEIGLHESLGKYSKEILCMAYAHCIDHRGINRMEQWFRNSNIGYALELKNVTEKRFLKALDDLESGNLDLIQQIIFSSVKKKYKLSSSGVTYDVTNTYLYGKKCRLGRLGKSKEGRNGKPLIQIGLGTTKEEGIPIFHKVFKGNIQDSRIFLDMLTDFQDFGIGDGIFVFDRGISSGLIQKILSYNNWDVVCGLKITDPIKQLITELQEKGPLQSIGDRVDSNGTIFYVTQVPYSIDNIEGTLAICFNAKKRFAIEESLLKNLAEEKEHFKTKNKVREKFRDFFSNKGELLILEIENHLKFKGFSLIFTTKQNISSDEIVRTYFDKDLIEKAFKVLKGIIGLRPIRHWLSKRVTAHVFICYLSYLILSIFQYKIRSLKLSIERALEELETAYISVC